MKINSINNIKQILMLVVVLSLGLFIGIFIGFQGKIESNKINEKNNFPEVPNFAINSCGEFQFLPFSKKFKEKVIENGKSLKYKKRFGDINL